MIDDIWQEMNSESRLGGASGKSLVSMVNAMNKKNKSGSVNKQVVGEVTF
jgi:hypothetical protein